MQQNVNSSLKLLHSQSFIKKFTKVLQELYAYKSYMDFLVVSSIIGKKTLSYLPLLSYSDRTHQNIADLLELGKDNHFQIKTLNFEYKDYKKSDTVTMRLFLEGKSSQELFNENIKSRCRNKIKNSLKKNNFSFAYGNAQQDIDDFYKIFSETVHKHGTPVLDKKLFIYLRDEFQDQIVFYNLYDGTSVIASMCIILDGDLAWYPWGGVDPNYTKKMAGYYIYWSVLQDMCDRLHVKIFDFGRSSYGGPTYDFKLQFGALPVKIDIICSEQEDIYEKYSLASNVWKKLPKILVDFMGPKLCKYLVDL